VTERPGRHVRGADRNGPLDELVGESPAIVALREQVRRLAALQAGTRRSPSILLEGETGTGKGLLARSIHRAGPRAAGPFQAINCAALPEHLVEAELFGFEPGAFTDARRAKPGLFQAAAGGTLFLDEIGLLPEAAQSKLLTAIEERKVRRLGATRDEPVDVTIIAASNLDLAAAVRERRFREDLYHRLAVVKLTLPPLRDRGADIITLARTFLERACREYGVPPKSLGADAQACLLAHAWPGNVRELTNVMERVAVLTEAATVSAAMLGLGTAPGTPPPAAEADGREQLHAVLEETGWNISLTARRLGITRNTVKARIARHDLRPGQAPTPAARLEMPPRPAASAQATPADRPPGFAAETATPARPLRPLRWVSRRVTFLRAVAATVSGDESYGWSRLVESFVDKLEAFGGRLAGLSPSGLLAAFGAEPMEDASRRAAHAAIVMAVAAERARRDDPTVPAVRLALHSEQVELAETRGGIEIDTGAQRRAMETLDALVASPGEDPIAVSAAAADLLSRYFELTRLPTAGPDEAPVYALRGREGSPPATTHRTAFVGRREELDLLRSRLASALGGHGQVVAIAGEAGIGKSRLVFEWRRGLSPDEVLLLEGHCHPHGTSLPFLPVLEIVRRAFRITEADGPERVQDNVRGGLERLGLPAEQMAPYLLRFLGSPAAGAELAAHSPEAVHAQTLDVLRSVSLRASRTLRPIVMLVEDLHWIDDASAAYLASIVSSLAGAPIMVVVTYRQGYQPAWLGRSYVTQVGLAPLSSEDSRRALMSLPPAASLPPGAADLILARAEGNPFFLEELTQTMAAAGQTGVTAVPGTVHEVLLARIERLPDAERELLQAASVIGRDFAPALLDAMTEGDARVAARLAALVEAEFLYEAVGADEPVYAFKHALTHDVVYGSLAPAQRRQLHAAVARALERRFAGRLDETVDQIAFHYGASDLHEPATRYLAQAARRSAEGYANVEAVAFLDQALAHAERLEPAERRDRTMIRLVFAQVHSLGLLGRFQIALERLTAIGPRLTDLRDPALSAEYHFWLGRTFSVTGFRERAVAAGQRALADARQAGDEALIGKAHHVLGYECYFSGSLPEGVGHAREAVAHLARTGERYWLASAYWVLALNHGPIGDFDASLEALARTMEIADAMQDPKLQSAADWTAGSVYALRGDWDRGIETARRGLDRSPNPLNTALAMGFLGAIYVEKGDTAQAIPLLDKAIAQMGAFRALEMHAWLSAVLGEGYLLAGDLEPARATLDEARRLAQQARYWWAIGWAERALGRMALAAGAPEQAPPHLHVALAAMEGAGARFEAARTRLVLARATQLLGDAAAAARHLAEAREVFTRSRAPLYIARAEALARDLGLPAPQAR
jgi:DNA-binding NtrC family response regulator/tetratricopeptide (TPR) repeat protein